MPESRLIRGFVYGIVATIAMSVLMVIATVSGVSPIPEPIPKAIVVTVVGGASKPVVMALAIGSHLVYGGVFGAFLARAARPVTLANGIGLGVALWVLMQVAFLPFLGWGVFGTAITPKIAVATLVLHLVYGAVLGWTIDRDIPVRADRSTSTPS
jgi:hypothetical protein